MVINLDFSISKGSKPGFSAFLLTLLSLPDTAINYFDAELDLPRINECRNDPCLCEEKGSVPRSLILKAKKKRAFYSKYHRV